MSSRTEKAREVLDEYLKLGRGFVRPPKTELQLLTQAVGETKVGARDVAISTAIQCYAAGEATMKVRDGQKWENLADSTLDAGHLTTRQHVSGTWRITASRSVVHDVLHQYIYYNTEQQSQRYVEAKSGSFIEFENLSERQKRTYAEAAEFTNAQYFVLLEKLRPEVEKRVYEMYPQSSRKVERAATRLGQKVDKLCQEVARYVLPVGQETTLYYTLSELQLLRLFQASKLEHFSGEAKYLVASMIASWLKYDPSLLGELREPEEGKRHLNFSEEYISQQKAEFDKRLGDKYSTIRKAGNPKQQLCDAVRNVLGLGADQLGESQALDYLLNPKRNVMLASVYETGMVDPLNSCLRQVNLSFDTKLSHAGDSQRQRHRRTVGATPSLEALYDGRPDFVTPLVVREDAALSRFYSEVNEQIYNNIGSCIEMGIPKEQALLLLPNSQTVRVVESGDMLDWVHRWKQRLCFLAQEEIFWASLDQAKDVISLIPEARSVIQAPCAIRKEAGLRPRCPEGERWCGQPVFNWGIEKYRDFRLI